MNPELLKDIRKSTILNTYTLLLKITPFTDLYKKILISIFIIGFISTVFGIEIPYIGVALISIILPAMLVIFVMAIFHFLAGLKIDSLSKKYNISSEELLDLL